jgi:hypothetical protein
MRIERRRFKPIDELLQTASRAYDATRRVFGGMVELIVGLSPSTE